MEPVLRLLEDELPATVQNLIRLAGWSGAMALVREMHGARIYCPPRGPEESGERFSRVAELTSVAAARRIYAEYRGDVLEIPTCRAAMTAARNRWVRAQYDAGVGVEPLCIAAGLSRRQLFTVLKQPDDVGPAAQGYDLRDGQMGLF